MNRTPRITTLQVWQEIMRVEKLLAEAGITEHPTVYFGDHLNRVSNKFVVDKTQVWPDNMAGFNKRELYNALRIMASTLSLVIEARQEACQS